MRDWRKMSTFTGQILHFASSDDDNIILPEVIRHARLLAAA